jgi:[ribosomal protein S5]-alanine N-acetyltransferase
VLERLGMMREGKKRKFLPVEGQWIDSYIYGILYEDF